MGKRLTDEEREWRTYSEKKFQTRVIDLARENGWLVAHFHDSQKMVRRGNAYIPVGDKDARGFPDLVLVRGLQLYFWELKKEVGYKISPAQEQWIAALQDCGLDACFMFPHDWDNIHKLLTS